MKNYDRLYREIAPFLHNRQDTPLPVESIWQTDCPYLKRQADPQLLTTTSDAVTTTNDLEINHG